MNTILADFDASLELFFGEANPAETRVYARCSSDTSVAGLALTGTLTGPYCHYAQTLPATIAFTDRGPAQTLLAQAVVPDPCFWTPELPFHYQARIELRRGREVLQTAERMFGIRPLGCRDRRFYYEGKPWVLRGVLRTHVSIAELTEFREADAALFIANPDDAMCTAASHAGVLLVADLAGNTASAVENIRRLARHAAVGFLVFDNDAAAQQCAILAPNVVCVARRLLASSSQAQPNVARLCKVDPAGKFLEHPGIATAPIIAWRPAAGAGSVLEHRQQCDHLQRDLAGSDGVAGYLV